MALASIRPFLVRGIERQISSATSAYAATSRPAFSILALFGPDGLAKRGLFVGVKRTSIQGAPTSGKMTRTGQLTVKVVAVGPPKWSVSSRDCAIESGPEDGGDSSQDAPRGGRLNPVVVVNDRDADHDVG